METINLTRYIDGQKTEFRHRARTMLMWADREGNPEMNPSGSGYCILHEVPESGYYLHNGAVCQAMPMIVDGIKSFWLSTWLGRRTSRPHTDILGAYF